MIDACLWNNSKAYTGPREAFLSTCGLHLTITGWNKKREWQIIWLSIPRLNERHLATVFFFFRKIKWSKSSVSYMNLIINIHFYFYESINYLCKFVLLNKTEYCICFILKYFLSSINLRILKIWRDSLQFIFVFRYLKDFHWIKMYVLWFEF